MGAGGDNRPEGTAPEPRFGSLAWRAGNAFVGVLARVGVGPIQLLTTRRPGTGRPHTVPVVPVDHDGRRWLVAPYGAVGWVRDVRARSGVSLRYGRARHEYDTREASADEAGPVLKRYVAVATKTRAQFAAHPDAPAEEFAAEADRHPVFELVPLGGDPPRPR